MREATEGLEQRLHAGIAEAGGGDALAACNGGLLQAVQRILRQDAIVATIGSNLHHVVTIPRAGLRRFVGSASAATMARVRAALLVTLGWDDGASVDVSRLSKRLA